MKAVQGHFIRLDVLRGWAIFLVFLHHYALAVESDPRLRDVAALPTLLQPMLMLHHLGFLGVQLFFVISGFCIHNSYLNWKAKNAMTTTWRFWPRFFHRRAWRILPPYYLALLTFYFWQYYQPLGAAPLKHLSVHATLLNTLFRPFFYNINPSFWSIAVEWQLYIIYPFFCLLLIASSWRTAFAVCTILAFAFRFAVPFATGNFAVSHLPFAWWYDWTIGAAVAAAFAQREQLFRFHFPLGLALAAATVCLLVYWHVGVLCWALPPLTFAVILEGALWSNRKINRLEHAFSLLGLCSYSFYLFHQPLVKLFVSTVLTSIPGLGPFRIWVFACLAIFLPVFGLSWLSYRQLELRSVALGERLVRRKQIRTAAPISGVQTLP